MAEQFGQLDEKHILFIREQHLFFVGTSGAEGRINVSPKGLDTLRVKGPNQITWLNLTGSGNETSAHVQENGRMTLMFCSFGRQPLILRVYGDAKVVHRSDDAFEELVGDFDDHVGARQIFDMQIELVQTSCGYAVPYFDLAGERETLTNWADKKGIAGIEAYWSEKNETSIDGKPISFSAEE